jgi:ketosteroid isomerase-like protein
MMSTFLRSLTLSVIVGVVVAGTAFAEDCSGTITGDEAVRAEDARYAAQTANDVAAMEKLFGPELVYSHSSASVDNKAAFIDSMKSGRIKYRTMKRSEVTVRTYGCVAVISGIAEFGVTFGGQDRTVPLRFHSIWAKRPDGAIQFVSGQATGIPA